MNTRAEWYITVLYHLYVGWYVSLRPSDLLITLPQMSAQPSVCLSTLYCPIYTKLWLMTFTCSLCQNFSSIQRLMSGDILCQGCDVGHFQTVLLRGCCLDSRGGDVLLLSLKVNAVMLGVALSAMYEHSKMSALWRKERTNKHLFW